MRISKLFSLGKSQYELDFIDIDVDVDLPLFLDSYYINTLKTPIGIEAAFDINSFIRFFFGLLKSDLEYEAQELFSYLGEPNETCLGMSQQNPQGKGVGPTDTQKIFKGISQSKVIQLDIMENLEDLRIFVPGIDKDKTSDMTTNIIRGQLVLYTQNQCKLWGIPLQSGVPSGFTWNRKTLTWDMCHTDMLVINDRKILLVPKSFASFSKDYTPQKYLQHFVLNFIQAKHMADRTHLLQVRIRKNGSRREWVTKKSIKEDLEKTLNHIDKDFLTNFTANNPMVFRNFKEKTKNNLRTLLNEELTLESLETIVIFLKEKLTEMPTGSQHATEYHRTVTGILELLLYPHLCNPILEKEIHEGRKRIDLVFANNAETGFFYRLPTVHQIPSSFIMVECKNYTADVANAELDQLSGRFSVNRGQFGLLLCRDIDDMDRFMARCNDTHKDHRGVIIPITDTDLLKALDAFIGTGTTALEDIMKDKFAYIALN